MHLQDTDTTIEDAINELVSTLGNIEFRLGLESMAAKQMDVAFSNFKLAATHNHAGATYNLGVCYELGLGVRKSMKRAFDCYHAASALGHPKAMYNLGVCYARGLGGSGKSRQAANRCFVTAARLGLSEAQDALNLTKKPILIDDEVFIKAKSPQHDEGYKSEPNEIKYSSRHHEAKSALIAMA